MDLPGTYSLTSYSLEERVARDFLLHEDPAAVVNVVDATNLKRNLHLTLQLMEMGLPVIVALNMMDVAEQRGIEINWQALSERPARGGGRHRGQQGTRQEELRAAIARTANREAPEKPYQLDTGPMEPFLRILEAKLAESLTGGCPYPGRWLALKLMEGDEEARRSVCEYSHAAEEMLALSREQCRDFEAEHDEPPEQHIGICRHLAAEEIVASCVQTRGRAEQTLSDRVDVVVCNRFAGPLVLLGIVYLLYELAIVQGYRITNYTWPLLAWVRGMAADLLPSSGFIEDPQLRTLGLWFVDSVNALLNYIPIFFILFGLIAVLEDVGYLPRMAFLLDRLLRRFGLHGQSVLPLILGGVFVGGCAIPGVMACRAVPDERSRLTTILIVPLMNCLAKVPLYVLLIGMYFPEHRGPAMFFIATVTIFMALPIAKVLNLTVFRNKESAPFILEMPPYHLPTLQGVLHRAVERVWLFLKKIVTVVAVVAVVVYALLQYPGLGDERREYYRVQADQAVAVFHRRIAKTPYAGRLEGEGFMTLIHYREDYKKERTGAGRDEAKAIDEVYRERDADFFQIIKPRKDKDAQQLNRALKTLLSARREIRREIKNEKIKGSFLGGLGRALEPATRWAGFNWRVNIALLSSLAAKESSVATLGALYQPPEGEGDKTLGDKMKRVEEGFTPLHALALMLFMALYPPCIPTFIAIKLQSGAARWMIFSLVYPTVAGFIVAALVFSGGGALGLSGLQAMWAFYALAVTVTLAAAAVKPSRTT